MNIRFATFLAALAAVAGSVASAPSSASHKVHQSVHRALQTEGTVNLIVTLGDGTESVLESFQEAAYVSRAAKIQALKGQLESAHAPLVAPVTKMLSQEATSASGLPPFANFKTFWISNQVFIESATFDLVEKLSELPSVAEIREEVVAVASNQVASDASVSDASTKELVGYEWNVQKIGAPKVWADGNIGQGVLVASIGSGVRASHEALARNFIGDKLGWFDPENPTGSLTAKDVNGLGTHLMATIAGSKGVGVAPGASWMTCKGCRVTTCPESDLIACAQWILCPPSASSSSNNGTSTTCGTAPRVVHNSWSGVQNDNWFKPSVDAWEKADIVPIFPSGDAGGACGSITSPGDYPNVISVGSVSSANALSAFGAKGPGLNKRTKPDIVAPGSRTRAAGNASDTDYITKSSTSIAAAHIAGSVALLLSAQPDFSVSEVKVALFTTTDQTGLAQTAALNLTCGGTSDKVWPNNQFGHGLVNALNLYEGFRPSA
ncbi:hypothetical protein Gpo141_00014056 [Globisporangium polare]